jgi:sugar phosphate isomerase/epimerase
VYRLGYNTNGFAHHKLEDALPIIAGLGYQSVAITLDHYALNPFDKNLHKQMGEIRHWLETLNLKCVIETGARFLLDSRWKHQPTLLSPNEWERNYRLEFLTRAVWIAEALGADCMSFWSGTPADRDPPHEHWHRLIDGCRRLCEIADRHHVDLAFEPEPGMLVDTTAKYDVLAGKVDHPRFGLTLDVGHVHCMGEPMVETILTHAGSLRNVHLEDMRHGVHDHLMFGKGEIDFPPVLHTLERMCYAGGVHVELSRHSHDAVTVARQSIAFLTGARSTPGSTD